MGPGTGPPPLGSILATATALGWSLRWRAPTAGASPSAGPAADAWRRWSCRWWSRATRARRETQPGPHQQTAVPPGGSPMSRRARAFGFLAAALICALLAASLAGRYRSRVEGRYGPLRPVVVSTAELAAGEQIGPEQAASSLA